MSARTRKIVILNPKGGSGKTTVATTLASYFANAGECPTLMDFDPQGSSMHWLGTRPDSRPSIHGIAAYEKRMDVTRSFQLRIPEQCRHVVVDSPAGYDAAQLRELTRDADKVLMPVLPSKFDIHAASRCIADLLLVAKLNRNQVQLGVVANRTRRGNRVFDTLMRFLESLGIPVVAILRDAQVYVRASELGLGLFDLRPHEYSRDIDEWNKLIAFVESSSDACADASGLDETPMAAHQLQSVS